MQPVFDIDLYNERLNALFSRFQSVQKVGFKDGAYKPGLDGMRRFSTLLGDPWRQYPCIHVAGTNGKGSVCSMLAAALAARAVDGEGLADLPAGGDVLATSHPHRAGGPGRKGNPIPALPVRMIPNVDSGRRNGHFRIGLYTSPHLLDFRERMKIVTEEGFEMISREEVWEFLCRYEADFEGLSFFEITTGMAFWWFARRGVDAAVIEAGLGGRLDSTNIITPVLSVVTSIGLDHCALLGSTRSEIAREKAGIFKPGVPAVIGGLPAACISEGNGSGKIATENDSGGNVTDSNGVQGGRDAETAPVFEEVAAAVGAPLVFACDVPEFPLVGNILSETELLARMDLCGPCQNLNLHTVLVCLSLDLPQISAELGKVPVFSEPPAPNISGIGEGQGVEGATCPEKEQNWGRSGGNSRRSEGNWVSSREIQCENLMRAIAESGKRTGLWGRWQRVCLKPEVVCDIGHNPPALKENFAQLEALCRGGAHPETAENSSRTQTTGNTPGTEIKGQTRRQLIIVYGIMADKDLAGIAPMMPSDAIWILTAPDSPRSLPAEDLKAKLADLRPDIAGSGTGLAHENSWQAHETPGRAIAIPSVAEAIQYALDLAQDLPNPFVYIGGSTFVVAEALPLFNEKTAI